MQVDISSHFLRQISAASLMVISLSFFVTNPGYSQQPSPSKDNLAKVALLGYEDRTGSQNYLYLSDSITTSIDSNMQAKFDFAPINPDLAAKTANEIRTKSGKFSGAEAKEFCKLTNTDILIYGYYEYDPISNQIVIKTEINFALINRTVTLDPLTNPIDASLFQVTEIAATKIVEKISEMARKLMAQNTEPSGTGVHSTETQKVTLAKISEISWSRPDVEISISGGFSRQETGRYSRLDKGTDIILDIMRISEFKKSYGGFSVIYLDHQGNAGRSSGYGGLLTFGVHLFLIGERTKPFVELGFGYGSYATNISAATRVLPGGVWLGGRFGVRFLISKHISISLDARLLGVGGDAGGWATAANIGLGYVF